MTLKSEKAVRVPLLTILWTYFRIGLMTFGGGFAMATVVRHELVIKRKWLDEKEFVNTLSLATAVPGSIAVNLAFIEGGRLRGIMGAVCAAIGTISPSVIVILLIARFGAPYFDHPVVGAFLKGCSIAVAGQIGFAALTFARKLRPHWKNMLVCGLGLSIVAFGSHPIFAVGAAAAVGYLVMYEQMTPQEKADEMEILRHLDGVPAPPLLGEEFEKDIEDVVREPDGTYKEKIDDMIEDCPILDLDGPMDVDEFFEIAGKRLASDSHLDADSLIEALKEREEEDSTVVNEWAAVPHVILEDEDEFEMLIARSREGVYFSEESPQIHAMFVIVGSLDQRDLYMSALAYIGEVAANPGFQERWRTAMDEEHLRELIFAVESHKPE